MPVKSPGKKSWSLRSSTLGELPIVNHFADRLGLDDILDRYLPCTDRRMRLRPAKAIGLLIRNVLAGRTPVYALEEWAAPIDPAVLRIAPEQIALLNDDRVGRALDHLFDADRASLTTELVVRAIGEFGVELEQLHNDSTTVTFCGEYLGARGQRQRGKATLRITRGHNKDHRPDLKQLLWILTVSADGAVPVHFRACDGNTTDDQTHVETWQTLRRLIGRADFLYVADSKLCTRSALGHIAAHGGRFLTVLPRTRREDGWFRNWVQTHTPEWVQAIERRNPRRGDGAPQIYRVFEPPLRSAEGYRIIWVWSSLKADNDERARAGRIEEAVQGLERLQTKLRGPRSRLRERAAVAQAAEAAIERAGAARWLDYSIEEYTQDDFRQAGPGRPGPDTRYRRRQRCRFRLAWHPRTEEIDYDTRTDGMFPLLTNDNDISAGVLLEKYKYQPRLEKRHEQLKSVRAVAPVFLKSVTRIEALLLVYFLALLLDALIEREMRRAMQARKLKSLPLYPEQRSCQAPTTDRLLDIFGGVQRHELYRRGRLVQTFAPELSTLQLEILDFLGVPRSAYAQRR